MLNNPQFAPAVHAGIIAKVMLFACALCGLSALESAYASAIPERCLGYGALQSHSETDWEAGLGAWIADTQNVANPATFETPDWSVAGSLPDGRGGQAAFVPNLVLGNCNDDDESGVLTLRSPSIAIPMGVEIPRISIVHWFQIESEWDGGIFRVSVNGGSFNKVPPSAIETFPYNATLFPPLDEFGQELNTNPLAGQETYTGTHDGDPTGDWVETRINLLGIADGGDSVRLRIDFGLDGCTIAEQIPAPVGWFVDEVEVYSCEAELPPSNCGNGVVNGGEQCDDGNDFIGDGCSNSCQIEAGWSCVPPTPSTSVPDGGFEAGRPNPNWDEMSNNFLGSPICNVAACSNPGGINPHQGSFWAWFGGFNPYQEGSVSQAFVLPDTAGGLQFQLAVPLCDSQADYLEVLIDGNQVLVIDGSSSLCGFNGYSTQLVDIEDYADNASHLVEFHSETFSVNGSWSNFFVDSISLPGKPSQCRRDGTSLTLIKDVVNDGGGTALTSAWTLDASGPSAFNGPGPVVWGGTPFQPGTYNLSESGGPPAYAASEWNCDEGDQLDGDTVTVALDEAVTCTITNDDISPTLTVINAVVNDHGGAVTDPEAFGLELNGQTVPNNVPQAVEIGDHMVSADGLPGYLATPWGGDCNPDGTILLTLGQNAVCTITNDDIPARLTVLKSIVNDDDGTVTDPDAFGLQINGNGVDHGVVNEISAGVHTVSEIGHPDYVAGPWGGDCDPAGTVSLELDEDATCTIENDDLDRTSLTLVKQVINNSGGSQAASAWTLTATGPSGFSGAGPNVASGQAILPGVYHLSESTVTGYLNGGWVCVGATQLDEDSIQLAVDEIATCTITNDDIPAQLTVLKEIVNDNGGTVSDPDAFQLRLDDAPVFHNIVNEVSAGVHIVSEIGLPGYEAGLWGGDCNPDGSIMLSLGESATCTITNDDIGPTLTLLKTIVNDNGGNVTNRNSFGLRIDNTTALHGIPKAVNVGPHIASEIGLSGYEAGPWGGDCNPDGTIDLALGQHATCTITNDDIAPTIRIFKTVTNDNGGTVTDPDAFGLKLDGMPVFHDVVNVVDAGSHFASEDGLPGYEAGNWGGDCASSGAISVGLAENATCTITNNDSDDTRLTLAKNVFNSFGGTATPSSWTMMADGPSSFSGSGPLATSGPGLLPGTYDLSESGPPGYSASDWTCNSDGQVDGDTVVVELGELVFCSINNFDIPPRITVINTVMNNDGGTAMPNDFGLKINGNTVMNNIPAIFAAGDHIVSAVGLSGYQQGSWGGDCQADGSISLSLAQEASCTIVHDDIAPTLTLFKDIVNDNGGTVEDPNEFGLRIDGNPVQHNVQNNVSAGNHFVSEIGVAGYVPGPWSSPCNPDGTITLSLGQNATCSITNDDTDATSLTLVKQVVNDNGGPAMGSDWTLTATGPTGFSGTGPVVTNGTDFSAGTYDLSESDGPGGYGASDWECVGGTQDDGDTISLELGESATCMITNDDLDNTSLTLIKEVQNDNGGTAQASAWTLGAIGPRQLSGSGPVVSSGSNFSAGVYELFEENGPPGYAASEWECSGGNQIDGDTVELSLGDSATCTITNDDQAPSLTLDKVVTNNNGGTAQPSDWTLMADGPTPLSGPGAFGNTDVESGPGFDAGTYTLSESDGPDGYTPSSWSCSGGSQNGNEITLTLGQSATCTIVNNDDAPNLTLDKVVTNNNGGSAQPSEWTLMADGPTTLSGPGAAGNNDVESGPGFEAGTYTLSESGGPAGYTPSSWSCSGGTQDGNEITLTVGQGATCTIVNDDDGPGLTLIKEVSNDNGGTAQASGWTLTATGPTGFSGPGPSVSNGPGFQAGTYNLSESNGPGGYSASAWDCVGGNQDDADTITLEPGQSATCTITNDDQAPSLTLNKMVTNNNGGSAQPSEWTLMADGPTPLSGPGAPGNTDVESGPGFEAGTYTLSETGGPEGYTASNWSCSGGSQNGNEITLTVGQSASCTIVNNDDAPGLTLVKQVTSDNGGTAQASGWTLTATGPTGFSGAGPSVSNGPNFEAGTYDLSESNGPSGYAASAWVCVGGNQNDDDTVTLEPGQSATCTITNDDQAPSLTLDKVVTNNNGGTAQPSDWTLMANGPTPLSGPGALGNSDVESGPAFEVGTYTLSETGGPEGYTASTWNCIGGSQNGNQITLALGQSATCTIINDDDAPGLTLVKEVDNNNGGTAQPSEWTLTATGPTGFSGPGPMVSNGPGFHAGTYDLSESNGPGSYAASTWDCVGGNQDDADTITLEPGQSATCTITNDDQAPSLTLDKVVTNNNGGTAQPSDWTLIANGPTPLSGPGAAGNTDVQSGPGFDAGIYTLSESGGPDGYTASAWSCSGGSQNGNQITLALGQSATCTIVNDDDAPGLTLVKEVDNNNGGTAQPAGWTLTATGPTGFSGPGPSVSNGPGFEAGTYDLSESNGPSGYSASAWVCVGGTQDDADTITLAAGQSATCTITNDDQVPSLTLDKVVTNNNGGDAQPSDWTLMANGPTPLSGPGAAGNTDVQSGPGFEAGTYTLSESSGPGGYTASAWNCSGGSQNGNQITLTVGQSATCTITNDDQVPSLTLDKVVTNNNGGTAQPSDWTLIADGPTPLSGPGAAGSSDVQSGPGFEAGSYTLSESSGPDGYTASAWNCTGGSQNGNEITLTVGQSASCTIVNDDDGPGLTLVKEVDNDNGGTAQPSEWTLTATGPTGFSGPGPSVSNGPGFQAGTYDLSESNGPGGYNAGAWVCVGGSQDDADTITLEPGQSATCTITNDDQVPNLTLDKVVTNNNGGSAQPSNWTLMADGPTPLSGPGATGSTDVQSGPTFSAGTYTLSESTAPGGYTASAWSCSGGSQNGNQITLALGQSATCTITNNDQAPSLTLNKVVTNNNGGSALPSAWTLMADGPTPLSGPGAAGSSDVQSGPGFEAGTYTLSESTGPDGYTASAWNCTGGAQNDNEITLTVGQSAACTIVNDDDGPGLTLIKEVDNDNGGTAEPSAWTLTATGPTGFSGPGPSVSNGPGFQAGTYDLSESNGPSGYAASAWVCVGGSQDDADTITLAPGQSATCTITNDDQVPNLTLDKVVTNNNGGTSQPSDWTLMADGPTPLSGPGAAGNSDVQSGPGFEAGTYMLSESTGPDGYTASAWNCTGGAQNGNEITLTVGQSATCTIVNDDDGPGLTLIKEVDNDNGGTAQPSQWTLTAAGPTGFSGPGPSVSNGPGFQAGTYDLSESNGPGGYNAGAWVCVGGSQDDADTITLEPGQSANCTITNDDQVPSLTLDKVVTNNNGGDAQPSAWTLMANGPTPLSGPGAAGNTDVQSGPTFSAGTYTLSESSGPGGYTPSPWNCTGGSQNGNEITLTVGQSAICTIVNDDDGPGLTLIKEVDNDNGGTAQPSEWTLTATGPTGFSGPGPMVSNGPGFQAGTYDLSESNGPSGYSASAWVCVGGTQDDDDTITLEPGQSATCTITNDDNAVGEVIINDGFESK